ncbi:hypothetical protein GobsT_27890 [Gemmata obscuriglobus]|nr:hypothetical protein GobsT_27890 [Gemmata obscuriglobus]VTS05566.1 unnamed protein product [Gemmata obscuriglobus UQM 2246]
MNRTPNGVAFISLILLILSENPFLPKLRVWTGTEPPHPSVLSRVLIGAEICDEAG